MGLSGACVSGDDAVMGVRAFVCLWWGVEGGRGRGLRVWRWGMGEGEVFFSVCEEVWRGKEGGRW